MKNIFILTLSLFLFSCQSKKSKLISSPENLQLIDVSEIYDAELADQALKKAADANREEANKHFLEGLKQYRNNKSPAKSLAHFKMSLAVCPNAKVYYELGNALIDLKNYKEAIVAYLMAERFDYTPYFKLAYNIACAYAKDMNTESALEYLQIALNQGYSNKDHLLKDPDLESIRKEKRFTALVVEHFSDATDQRQVLFDLFLENFSGSSLPYELSASDVNNFDFKKSISYDYAAFIEGMEDAEFSRDVVNDYMYGEILASNDSMVILTYGSHNSLSDTLGPNLTYLAVYTRNGKLIDQKLIGGNVSGTEYTTGAIDHNLIIRTEQFVRIWKDNPLEKGFDENYVMTTKSLKKEFFHIEPDGKIVEGDVAMGPHPE